MDNKKLICDRWGKVNRIVGLEVLKLWWTREKIEKFGGQSEKVH